MALRAMSHLPHGGILARSVATEDRAPAPAATKLGWANPPYAFPDRSSYHHQSSRSSMPAHPTPPAGHAQRTAGPVPSTPRWPRSRSPSLPPARCILEDSVLPDLRQTHGHGSVHSIPVALRTCHVPLFALW